LIPCIRKGMKNLKHPKSLYKPHFNPPEADESATIPADKG
jgi:hypothetical protein